MTLSSMVNSIVRFMADNYTKDSGKLLIHLGALGMLLGSVAQIGAIAFDKKIDKDEKQFLIPQEGLDGVANVALNYTICTKIKQLGDALVEKGTLLTDDIINEFKGLKLANGAVIDEKNWQSLFTQGELKNSLSTLFANPKGCDVFQRGLVSQPAFEQACDKALSRLSKHKNNVGVISTIFASVLASNIVAPYVRNSLASSCQKYFNKKEAETIRKTQICENLTLKNPLPTSFKSFNNYNTFSNVKI